MQAIASTVPLIQEARKLRTRQHITAFVPHVETSILEQKEGHCLSLSRMLKYPVLLLEPRDVELKTAATMNPAIFLDPKAVDEGALTQDCLQTMEQVYSSRTNLQDEPIENPDLELFTDGSSFMKDGKWLARYAVVTATEVLEAQSLPINTSARKAAIIALKTALNLAVGKRVNTWTDPRYAFAMIHAWGAIWKERGLLAAQGSSVQGREEILQLLKEF